MQALLYSIDEFNNILDAASNNNVEIAYNNIDGWFYTVAENYYEDVTDEIVYVWLSKKLNTTIVDIIIDICKDKVAVICR